MKSHFTSTSHIHEPLTGGRVTQNVIKIGNTVRRPLSKNANFVHRLLQHLELVGFPGSPRFLGIDESNREILSFLEGYVPPELGHFSAPQLIAAAKLIRAYHDATITFAEEFEASIICHNDLSPCNAVMKDDIPIAFIDFDAAAPGTRASDLAYAVWLWCDLGNDEISEQEQARRIKLMLSAYGLDDGNRQNFISEIITIQKKQIELYKLQVAQGLTHWMGAVKWGEQCMKWVLDHKIELEKESLTS